MREPKITLDESQERLVVTFIVPEEHSHADWERLNQACRDFYRDFPGFDIEFFYDVRPQQIERWFFIAIRTREDGGRFTHAFRNFARKVNFQIRSDERTQFTVWSAKLKTFS